MTEQGKFKQKILDLLHEAHRLDFPIFIMYPENGELLSLGTDPELNDDIRTALVVGKFAERFESPLIEDLN